MAKLLPLKLYRRIYSKVPRLCVELIIKSPKGIVLIKRGEHEEGPDKGTWHLPGKTLLFGETIPAGLRRVAKNETGLKVNVTKFLGYHDYRPDTGYGHTISLFFLATPVGGKLKDAEGREIHYFKKLPSNIGFGQRAVIKKFKV